MQQEKLVPRFVNSLEDEFGQPQRRFYDAWLSAWKHGKPLDVDSQYGYLFVYLLDIIKSQPARKLVKEIAALKNAYPLEAQKGSKSFQSYCNIYLAESYISLGELNLAAGVLYEGLTIDVYPFINNLLSLKFYIGEDVSGREIIKFRNARSKLTPFGRRNLSQVEGCIDLIIDEQRKNLGSSVLENWISDHDRVIPPGLPWKHIPLLNDRFQSNIRYYYIEDYLPNAFTSAQRWIREAENMVREQNQIPRIGEGWISETELYYRIKEAFPFLEVVQHASPKWLGKQHLDIYLPMLRVAIEYQGRQHDEPVEFFGGVEAFVKTQERDTRKRFLCGKNHVVLIDVRPGYDFDELENRIQKFLFITTLSNPC